MSVWRLVLKDATNVAVATYGPGAVDGDGGIVGFPSFDVDPSGNCVSLAFDAVSKRNLITPRSIIEVQRYDGTNWVAWWLGMVTTVGTTRSDEVQRYAALGLKQYFYERVLVPPRWPTAPDVTADAAALPEFSGTSNGDLNAQLYGVTTDGTSAPTTGFQIGVVLPYRQMAGEFLDQRANQVGAFVVPTGETYTYDGVTFNAGDTVPAVKWGVNADGLFFFRRTPASSIAVTESDPEVRVTWAPKSTEGKANTIDFTFIADVDRERLLNVKAEQAYSGPNGYFGGSWISTERTFVPLSARSPSSNPSFPVIERRFQVDNPLDFMQRNTLAFSANALWANISNATDSDPLTYADLGGSFTAITATGGTVTTVGDYTVHTFTSSGTFTVTNAGSNPDVEYLIVAGGGGGGAFQSGSGGGAGGMKTGITTVTATSYTITVGAGGAGGIFNIPPTNPTKGGNSSAFGVTAEGGGRGTSSDDNGKNGGSGGGASQFGSQVESYTGGLGNAGEGNNGGSVTNTYTFTAGFVAGGGGGAGGAAPSLTRSSNVNIAGAGGIGLESTITGTAVTYATGGAGNVSSGAGVSGAANTGNGGGGGEGANGGAGGSGIVVIRYRSTAPTYTRTVGTPFDFSSPTILVTSAGNGGTGVGAYVIQYASDEPLAIAIRRSVTITGTISGDAYTRLQTSEMVMEYPATNTDTEIRVQQIVIPALSPIGLPGTILETGDNTLFIYGVTGLRIYDAAFYAIDGALVDRVAEGLIQDPNSEAAVVDVQGFSDLATEIDITAIDSPSPIVMPVERIEYALTSNDGIVTRYYAGQRFNPELQTESLVIDAAIRRLSKTTERL